MGLGAAGRRKLLKLVVDNDANKPTSPDNKQPAGSTGGGERTRLPTMRRAGTVTEPEKPEGGPNSPDGGNAA